MMHNAVKNARETAFKVLYQLSRATVSQKPALSGYSAAFILELLDIVATALVTSSKRFGYEPRDLPFSNPGQALRRAYIIVVVLTGVLLATIVLVQGQAQEAKRKPTRAARVLRFMLPTMAGPLLVPLLVFLCAPFDCSAMQCSAAMEPVTRALSVICLVVLLPTVLVVEYMSTGGKAMPRHLTARVHGIDSLLYAIARMMCVCVLVVPGSAGVLLRVCIACIFLFHSASVALQLPYFEPSMNYLKCMASTLFALLVVGGFVHTAAPDVPAPQVAAVLLAALSGALPYLRYRMILRILLRIRPSMLMQVRRRNVGVSTNWLPRGAGASQKEKMKAGIHKMAHQNRDVKFTAPALPLQDESPKAARRGSGTGMGPTTVLTGLSAYEAELLVRAEVELAKPKGARRGCFSRKAPSPPHTLTVECGVWLLAQAMLEFKDDAQDLAVVKLENARFLSTYTASAELISVALTDASQCKPRIASKFLLYTWQRDLRMRKLERQRIESGRGFNPSNFASVQEYGQRLRDAMSSHCKAALEMAAVFRDISKQQTRLAAGNQQDAAAIFARVEKVLEYSSTARRRYERLMEQNSDAPYLLQLYSYYCRDVLNNPDLGALYDSAPKSGDAGASRSIASGDSARRVRRAKQSVASASVRSMKSNYRNGVLLLGLLCVIMLGATHSVFGQATLASLRLDEAARMEALTAKSVLNTRTLSLLAAGGLPTADTGNATIATARTLVGLLVDTMHNYPASRGARWDAERFTTVLRDGNVTGTHSSNIWDTVAAFAVDVMGFAADPAADYSHSLRWSYVMDNGMQVVVPALQRLTWDLHEHVLAIPEMFVASQVVLLGCLLVWAVTFGLVSATITANRMKEIQGGMSHMARLLSPLQLSALRHRSLAARARVQDIYSLLADTLSAVLDAEERGMGPTLGFTYDADVDKNAATPTTPILEKKGDTPSPAIDTSSDLTPVDHSRPPPITASVMSPAEVDMAVQSTADHVSLASAASAVTSGGQSYNVRPFGSADEIHSAGTEAAITLGDEGTGIAMTEALMMAVLDDSGEGREAAAQDSSLPLLHSALAEAQAHAEQLRQKALRTTSSRLALTTSHSDSGAELPWVEPDVDDIADSVGCGIFCANAQGELVYVNAGLRKLLGYSEAELVGQSVDMLLHGHAQGSYRDIMRQVSNRTMTMQSTLGPGRQMDILAKDGSTVPLLARFNLLRPEGQSEVYLVGVLADLRLHLAKRNVPAYSASMDSHSENDAADAQQSTSSHRSRGCTMLALLTAALAVVLILPTLAFLQSHGQLMHLSGHSHEKLYSHRLAFQVTAATLGCREATIGDGEIWDSATAAAKVQGWLADMDRTWFGLRYGDAELLLEGSVGRDEELDALQFAVLDDQGNTVGGIDSDLTQLARLGSRCAQEHDGSRNNAVGASYAAVSNDTLAASMMDYLFTTGMAKLQTNSNLYRASFEGQRMMSFATNSLLWFAQMIILLLVYLYTVRRVMKSLLHRARLMEVVVMMLPRAAQLLPQLKQYSRA